MTPQLFNFQNSSVRIIKDENDNIWFHGKDVCDALEYSKHRDVLAGLDDDEKRPFKVDGNNRKGNPNQTFIDESGLYSLILASACK